MTVRSVTLAFLNFVIVAILISTLSAYSAPASAFSVKVFDARTGTDIANIPVTGVHEDGIQTVNQWTNSNGIANFSLSPGNWRFTTCHQNIIYGSTGGNTASTWLVACYQLFIPLVAK